MADIESLSTVEASEEGLWMDVYNLNDEPVTFQDKPLRLKLLGGESEKLKQLARRESLHYIKRMQRNKDIDESEIERSERTQLEQAVSATVDWENVPLDGKVAECTPANVRKAYKKYNVLLRRVLEFIDDEARFTKGSSSD